MNNAVVTPSSSSHDTIALCAARLWELAGRPGGRDLEFWLKAEHEVQNRQELQAVTLSKKSPDEAGANKSSVPVERGRSLAIESLPKAAFKPARKQTRNS